MPQNGFKIGRAVVVVPLAEPACLKPLARGLNPTSLTYTSGAGPEKVLVDTLVSKFLRQLKYLNKKQ